MRKYILLAIGALLIAAALMAAAAFQASGTLTPTQCACQLVAGTLLSCMALA